MRRIVVLDANGNESARRDVAGDYNSTLNALDLDGDGCDEILCAYGERLHACRADLKELWSWPDRSTSIEKLLPASTARAGEVIITPALALDGITGQARWAGARAGGYLSQRLLDRGDSTHAPLLIGEADGCDRLPRGVVHDRGKARSDRLEALSLQPGLARNDPRWTRPLPWLGWLKGPIGPWGFLAAGGLACFNVVLPLLIVRLAAGRRRFSVRALMALPVAAVIPIMLYLVLEPVLPVGSSPLLASQMRLFTVGTLAGLPIVLYAGFVVWGLARWRWRFLAVLAAVTMLTSLIMAGVWLWFDMKSMPSIEHYGRTGWYLVLLPGAYAAGLFVLIGWAMRMVLRLIERRSLLRRTASMVVVAIDDG